MFLMETRSSILKLNCHLACPGALWERTRISYFTALTSARSRSSRQEIRGSVVERSAVSFLGSHTPSNALMNASAMWHGCSLR
jgi:hypothetical protein